LAWVTARPYVQSPAGWFMDMSRVALPAVLRLGVPASRISGGPAVAADMPGGPLGSLLYR
jgi:hypothetical protein